MSEQGVTNLARAAITCTSKWGASRNGALGAGRSKCNSGKRAAWEGAQKIIRDR